MENGLRIGLWGRGGWKGGRGEEIGVGRGKKIEDGAGDERFWCFRNPGRGLRNRPWEYGF